MRVAIVAMLVSCAHDHAVLAPAGPDLPPDQRVAAFAQLEPREANASYVSVDGGATWHPNSASIVLANGQEIDWPEDLLPVVGSASATAQYARRSAAARSYAAWSWAGFIVAGVSAYAVTDELSWNPSYAIDPRVGWPLAAVLVAGATIFSWYAHDVEADARRHAFERYPRDLGEHLNVCAHGLQVVPCN